MSIAISPCLRSEESAVSLVRADPGEQLVERKWLGQVIVGAAVQAADLFKTFGITRGKHHMGIVRPRPSHVAKKFYAVLPGRRRSSIISA